MRNFVKICSENNRICTYSGIMITSLVFNCFCKLALVSGIYGCKSVARRLAKLQQIPTTVPARNLKKINHTSKNYFYNVNFIQTSLHQYPLEVPMADCFACTDFHV